MNYKFARNIRGLLKITNKHFICTYREKEINNQVSYIYLIQERENFEKDNNVFKYGRTTQEPNNKINRLQNYKKGSKILLVMECENEKVKSIEKNIKVIFDSKFKKHSDGYEHYIGDKDEMKKIISTLICEK
jgi:hypothetical protein